MYDLRCMAYNAWLSMYGFRCMAYDAWTDNVWADNVSGATGERPARECGRMERSKNKETASPNNRLISKWPQIVRSGCTAHSRIRSGDHENAAERSSLMPALNLDLRFLFVGREGRESGREGNGPRSDCRRLSFEESGLFISRFCLRLVGV